MPDKYPATPHTNYQVRAYAITYTVTHFEAMDEMMTTAVKLRMSDGIWSCAAHDSGCGCIEAAKRYRERHPCKGA